MTTNRGHTVTEAERLSSLLVPGAPLEVASTKYDRSLHYRYPATVVEDTGESLRAWVPAGTPMRSYRGDRRSPRHVLRVHPADRDWNLEVMWEPDWRPSKHYVNVALPSTWYDGTLRFVDLDLDVSWWADDRVVLLDVDEFGEHRERFGYPDSVVERAWAAVDEVRGLISTRTPPFDRSLYAWRPSAGRG